MLMKCVCFVGGVSNYQSGGFILLQSGGSARVSLLLPGRHTPQPAPQLHAAGRSWRTRQLQQVNSALDTVFKLIRERNRANVFLLGVPLEKPFLNALYIITNLCIYLGMYMHLCRRQPLLCKHKQ